MTFNSREISNTLMAVIFLAALLAAAPSRAEETAPQLSGGPCLDCHRATTAGITVTWELSAHGVTAVHCQDCHASKVEVAHRGKSRVNAKRCGGCHSGALTDVNKGRHSVALNAPGVKGNAACTPCHRIADSCETCHSRHSTEPDISGRPETCGACHEAEAPLLNILATSAHGALHAAQGEPSCTTCHMNGGDHNISRGLAADRPENEKASQRGFMLEICARCHTPAFAKKALSSADRLRSQARAIVEEAKGLATGQNKSATRPPHALAGTENNTSEGYNLASMHKAYRTVVLGAYHQNQAATLRAMSTLKATLSKIKTTANTLKRIEALEKRVQNLARASTVTASGATVSNGSNGDNAAEALKRSLRTLKDSLLSAEIDKGEYQKRKDALLNEAGL